MSQPTAIRHAIAAMCLALPMAAFAHPGDHHGGFPSLVHLLTEPDHLAMILGAAFIGYFIHRRVRGQRARARRHERPDDR